MPPQYTIYTKKNRNRYKNSKKVGGLFPFKGQSLKAIVDKRHTSKIREGFGKMTSPFGAVSRYIGKSVGKLYNYWKVYEFSDFQDLLNDPEKMKNEAANIYKIFFYPNAELKKQNLLSRITRSTFSSLTPSLLRSKKGNDIVDDHYSIIERLKEVKATITESEIQESVNNYLPELKNMIEMYVDSRNYNSLPNIDTAKYSSLLKKVKIYGDNLHKITVNNENKYASVIKANSIELGKYYTVIARIPSFVKTFITVTQPLPKAVAYKTLNDGSKLAVKCIDILLGFTLNYQEFLDKLIDNIEDTIVESDQKYRYFLGSATLYCTGQLYSETELDKRILEKMLDRIKKDCNTPMEKVYNPIIAFLQTYTKTDSSVDKGTLSKFIAELTAFNKKDIDFPEFLQVQNTTQNQELQQYKSVELKKLDVRLKKINVNIIEMLNIVKDMNRLDTKVIANFILYISEMSKYSSYLYKTITALKITYNDRGELDPETVSTEKDNISDASEDMDNFDNSIMDNVINNPSGQDNSLDNDGKRRKEIQLKAIGNIVNSFEKSLVSNIVANGLVLPTETLITDIYNNHQMNLFLAKNEESNEEKLLSLLKQIYNLINLSKNNDSDDDSDDDSDSVSTSNASQSLQGNADQSKPVPSIGNKNNCEIDYNKKHLEDNNKTIKIFEKYIERAINKKQEIIVFQFIGNVLYSPLVNQAQTRRELLSFKLYDTEYMIIVKDDGSDMKGGADTTISAQRDPIVSFYFKHFFVKNASPTIASLRGRLPNMKYLGKLTQLPLNMWRRFIDVDPYRFVFRNEFYTQFMNQNYVKQQGIGLCSTIYKRACSELNDQYNISQNVFADKDVQRLIFIMKYQYTKALRYGRLDFLILYFRIFSNMVLGKKKEGTKESNLEMYEAKFSDFIRIFSGDYNYGIFAFSDLANFIAGILKIMSICLNDTVRNGVFGDVPHINDLLMKKYNVYNKEDEIQIDKIEYEIAGIQRGTYDGDENSNYKKGGSDNYKKGGLNLFSNPTTKVDITIDSFLINHEAENEERMRKASNRTGANKSDIIVTTEYYGDTSNPAVNINDTDFSKYPITFPKMGRITRGYNYILHMLNKYFDITESYGIFELDGSSVAARGLVSFLAIVFKRNATSTKNVGANIELFEKVLTDKLMEMFPMAPRAQSSANNMKKDPEKIKKWVKKVIHFSEKMDQNMYTESEPNSSSMEFQSTAQERKTKMDLQSTQEEIDEIEQQLQQQSNLINSIDSNKTIQFKNSTEHLNERRDALAREFVEMVTLTVDSRYFLRTYEEISNFKNGCIQKINAYNYKQVDTRVSKLNENLDSFIASIEGDIQDIESDEKANIIRDLNFLKSEESNTKKQTEDTLKKIENDIENINILASSIKSSSPERQREIFNQIDSSISSESELFDFLNNLLYSLDMDVLENGAKKKESENYLKFIKPIILATLKKYKETLQRCLEKTKILKEDSFLQNTQVEEGSINPDLLIDDYKSTYAQPLSSFVIRDVHSIVEYLYQYLNTHQGEVYYYPFHVDRMSIFDKTFNIEYARMIESYIGNAEKNPDTGDEKLVELMVSFSTSIILGFHMTGTTLAGIIPMAAMFSSSMFDITLISPIVAQIADPTFFNAGAILIRTVFSEWVDPKLLLKLKSIVENNPQRKAELELKINNEENRLKKIIGALPILNPFSMKDIPAYLTEKQFGKAAELEDFLVPDNVGFLVFNTNFVIKKVVYTETGKPIISKEINKEISDIRNVKPTMMKILINDTEDTEDLFEWQPGQNGFNMLFNNLTDFSVSN